MLFSIASRRPHDYLKHRNPERVCGAKMRPPSRKSTSPSPRRAARERLTERGIDFDASVAALGNTIRARRRALGLTQEALAEKMGVSIPWVGVLECARGSPSLEMLTLLAHELGTSTADLLHESSAGARLKGPARAGLAELNAALADLPPERAEAFCAAMVVLCKSLR